MSSSPPTDAAPAPVARWRNPAGWSLRTQLVAVMVGLLVILGVAVGAASEIYLHKALYEQLDAKLNDADKRTHGYFDRPAGLPDHGPGDRQGNEYRGAGVEARTIMVQMIVGGAVDPQSGTLMATPATDRITDPLPPDAIAVIRTIVPTTVETNVNLASLGDYRIIAKTDPSGQILTVTGLPLAPTQSILLTVASVTGGAVLFALIIAGWAGAVIIRRTLVPLSRVASTASRVSELRLDRGEVNLAQRVPDGDTDIRTEVGQVGAALNRMLDHVGSALEARHASEMQVRQFVADASHELRTPLAAIRGYAELSRRSRQPVPDEIAHVLNRVESEAKRMTTLVEDLLLLARLDAGRPLANDPVDLTALVVDAVSDAHAAGPRHNWQLDLPEEPVTVIGDPARLHQVLSNLLANARTHTPEGTTVTVGVSATDRQAMIRVVDAGPGIPVELRPHIFERFARGDSSRSRAAGSTGLGLSIVHAVVTAHGGRVFVTSEPGRTEFCVMVPRAPVAPSANALQQNLTQVVQ